VAKGKIGICAVSDILRHSENGDFLIACLYLWSGRVISDCRNFGRR